MGANDTNSVCICGVVCEDALLDHRLFGEAFYMLKLRVERLSGAVDIIPVTLPGRICDELPCAGDGLHVIGQLRSYNRFTGSGSRLMLTVFARAADVVDANAQMQNEVTLSGYICKPVILRTTPFQREIGDLLVAVNRAYNKSDYLPCILWGRNARFASTLPVGSHIQLTGRMQSREYQKAMPDGSLVQRTAYEVSCAGIELLE